MSVYTERSECIMCLDKSLTDVFETDTTATISLRVCSSPIDGYFIPYNVVRCGRCNTYQTKYLGNLDLIYSQNHVDAFGSVKSEMHTRFAEFVCHTKDITGILEIGASTDALPSEILRIVPLPYSVVDPDFRGDPTSIRVHNGFIEDLDLSLIEGNTILMSNVFEHFYSPLTILKKIQMHTRNKYIYLNHPNFSHCCVNDIYQILNVEHIFYVENDFIVKLFDSFGYRCTEQENYETHTVMFKFERTHEPTHAVIRNLTTDVDVAGYFQRMARKVKMINDIIAGGKRVYMWPASVHTTALFTGGVEYTKLAGLLDNSPAKIGKFFYGYNLECFSLKDAMASSDENTTIILGGSDCYLKELELNKTRATIVYLRDL
jgi:hypothetical protein